MIVDLIFVLNLDFESNRLLLFPSVLFHLIQPPSSPFLRAGRNLPDLPLYVQMMDSELIMRIQQLRWKEVLSAGTCPHFQDTFATPTESLTCKWLHSASWPEKDSSQQEINSTF